MTLSGNLGFVPLDEVLRLLTRSKQQGSVDVRGTGLRGRVFVGKGGIDLATTSDDDDLYRHLLNSGYADANDLRRISSGGTTLAAIAESHQPIVDLLREMSVESLYQISSRGREFEVREDVSCPFASPKSFELESLLEDAAEREREWEKVAEVVPDLTAAIALRRDLGDREEITVRVDDWKVLSEIGAGSSVREIADNLGTTEFWTARVSARLVKSGLVDVVSDHGDVEAEVGDEYQVASLEPSESTVRGEESAIEAGYGYEVPQDHPQGSTDASTDEETIEHTEPVLLGEIDEDAEKDVSWWQEPTRADESEGDDQAETPEVVAEALSEMPTVEGQDDDVTEDTEAFLEKVLSELDSTEPASEEGHGLLRRRRMGTLRDFSSDS